MVLLKNAISVAGGAEPVLQMEARRPSRAGMRMESLMESSRSIRRHGVQSLMKRMSSGVVQSASVDVEMNPSQDGRATRSPTLAV